MVVSAKGLAAMPYLVLDVRYLCDWGCAGNPFATGLAKLQRSVSDYGSSTCLVNSADTNSFGPASLLRSTGITEIRSSRASVSPSLSVAHIFFQNSGIVSARFRPCSVLEHLGIGRHFGSDQTRLNPLATNRFMAGRAVALALLLADCGCRNNARLLQPTARLLFASGLL